MVARAHAALHEWKEAQTDLLKVVKADRANRRGFALLGEVLLRRSDYERAIPVLQHAQNLDPANPAVLALLKRARAGQPLDPPSPIPKPVSARRSGLPAPARAGARQRGPHQDRAAPGQPPPLPGPGPPRPPARSSAAAAAAAPQGPDPAAAPRRGPALRGRADHGRRAAASRPPTDVEAATTVRGDPTEVSPPMQRLRRRADEGQGPGQAAPPARAPGRLASGRAVGGRRLGPAPRHPRGQAGQRRRRVAAPLGRGRRGLPQRPAHRRAARRPRGPGRRGRLPGRAGQALGPVDDRRTFIAPLRPARPRHRRRRRLVLYSEQQKAEELADHRAAAAKAMRTASWDGLQKSLGELQQALELDSSSALTFAEVAQASALEHLLYGAPPTETVSRAVTGAARDIKKPDQPGYHELVIAQAPRCRWPISPTRPTRVTPWPGPGRARDLGRRPRRGPLGPVAAGARPARRRRALGRRGRPEGGRRRRPATPTSWWWRSSTSGDLLLDDGKPADALEEVRRGAEARARITRSRWSARRWPRPTATPAPTSR